VLQEPLVLQLLVQYLDLLLEVLQCSVKKMSIL
jgi:hypothetical protein